MVGQSVFRFYRRSIHREFKIMTLVNPYCSVAELLIELKRQNDTTTKTNDKLEQAINSASRFIDSITDRIFYSKTLTNEYVDCYGFSENGLIIDSNRGNKINFPSAIISISSLKENDVALVANTDYYLYLAQGYITKNPGEYFTREVRGILLSGVMGYATTPGQIKHYCLAIASAISGLSAQLMTDENGDTVGVLRSFIPKWVMDGLEREKRRIIC